MKTTHLRRQRQTGSVLAIGLVIAVILCAALISYLSLVQHQNRVVARAQAWNAALALAEAGVEESLAQLNPGALVTNILANNGWSISDGHYQPNPARRDLAGGYFLAKYTPSPPPTIYATGFATVPALSLTIERVVEVRTTNAALFSVGLVARNNINLNGNSLSTDSFDSADPAHSNPLGQYDSAERLHNGDVASMYGTVDLGNRTVDGALYLGATANWNTNGTVTGSVSHDFNLEFPDVLPPYDPATATVLSTYNKKGIDYLLGNANYVVNGDFQLANNKLMVVNSPNAVLYVTGRFTMIGNSQIIVPSGMKLKLYVGGPSATFTTVNTTNSPSGFEYYGLPGNTSITMNGNASYVGTIYAPNANVSVNGGGSDILDVQGGMIVNSFTSNGHFRFHYDENLRRGLPPRGYVAISWREL